MTRRQQLAGALVLLLTTAAAPAFAQTPPVSPVVTGTPFPSTPAVNTYSLLKAGSGTETSSSATNVDTVAITGLSALDTLKVFVHLETTTQPTALSMLYNSTDSVQTGYLAGNGVITVAQGDWLDEETIGPKQSDTKKVTYRETGGSANNTQGLATSQATFTTDWTGNWTLALRQGGVTAGGTLHWKWSVYKVAGQ